MDAIKRDTFHGKSLELHSMPDVDQDFSAQLSALFSKIMYVKRLRQLTVKENIIIRIELEKNCDLLDFNEYVQNCNLKHTQNNQLN